MQTMGPPLSPWQLSLPYSPAQIMLLAIWNGYSIWQRLSGTIGTVTTISSSGVRPPERRAPHPDTLQLPLDSCIIVGIGTGCFFFYIWSYFFLHIWSHCSFIFCIII